jgi:hypothetical protein
VSWLLRKNLDGERSIGFSRLEVLEALALHGEDVWIDRHGIQTTASDRWR